MNKRTIPAIIIATLAAGATAAAPYYDVNITQQLCTPACVDETPVFAPQFSVKSIAKVGTSQYIIVIHVEGVITTSLATAARAAHVHKWCRKTSLYLCSAPPLSIQ